MLAQNQTQQFIGIMIEFHLTYYRETMVLWLWKYLSKLF